MAKTDYIVRAIPSSFVFSDMKLMTDKGAGEAKLFVGPKSKETEIDDFFRFGSGITYRFDKKNMLEYLLQVKMEYVFQLINQYKDANIEKWNEINHIISEMREADFYVKLEKFVDNSRYYVRADDEIFKKTFRKMVVPKLTDLILTKDDETQETILRLRVNYDYAKGSVDVDEEDPEERNKHLFRYWMGLQVKPEGDSDAGQPYSSSSIDQYVSNVANTPLSSMQKEVCSIPLMPERFRLHLKYWIIRRKRTIRREVQSENISNISMSLFLTKIARRYLTTDCSVCILKKRTMHSHQSTLMSA